MFLVSAACAVHPGPATLLADPGVSSPVDTANEPASPPTVDDAVAAFDLAGACAVDAFSYGDGTADILLSDERIVAWNGTALVHARSIGTTPSWRTAMRIPDLDGDGSYEIVAAGSYSQYTAYLTVYDGDVALLDDSTPRLWHGEYGVYWQTGATFDWEVVADLSGDDNFDFEVAYFGSRFLLVPGEWTMARDGGTVSADVDLFGVGDVSGDGENDRALFSEAGLELLTPDDAAIAMLAMGEHSDWTVENGGFAVGGDFDGDGHGDVLARRHDGTVRVLAGPHSDAVIDEVTVAMIGEAYDASAELLDIRVDDDDGDGRDDVLYAEGSDANDGAGALVLFRGPLDGELDYAAATVAWVGEPGDRLGLGAWWIDDGVFVTTGAG